jgi:hypothetical protein
MARKNIAQRIGLEGAEQVRQGLANLGKAGQEAFNNIAAAANKTNGGQLFGGIESATKHASVPVGDFATQVKVAADQATKLGGEASAVNESIPTKLVYALGRAPTLSYAGARDRLTVES